MLIDISELRTGDIFQCIDYEENLCTYRYLEFVNDVDDHFPHEVVQIFEDDPHEIKDGFPNSPIEVFLVKRADPFQMEAEEIDIFD